MKKERGKFLTAILIILSVGTIYGFVDLINKNFQEYADYYNLPKLWFGAYFWFSWILHVMATIGLWVWKKWAVYLSIATILIGLFIQVFFVKIPGIEWYKVLVLLLLPLTIIVVFLLWPISRKWKYFD
ncbi:hypothetical protein HYT60_01605 [Candidatus Woesebacteria bacterium]|nr:hypothetical protein [Candidatus Woesebacteria bacterium]